jgi:glycosyltransferase involved in cell wall biosynthesis
MNVLFLTREYPPYSAGGVSKHTYFLVKHLKKIDVNCRVLSFGYPDDSSNEVTFIEPNSSVSIHKTSLRENLNIFSDIKKINEICNELLEKKEFDIIHIEDPYFGPYLKDWNIVTTVHDTSFGEFFSLIKNIKTGLDLKYMVYFSTIGPILEHLTLRKSKQIITVFPHIKKELVNYYRLKKENIEVVPNGVRIPSEINKLQEKRNLGLENKTIIYSASRLIPRKRVDVLIKAINELKNSQTNEEYKILISGEGPQETTLKEMVKKYDLENLVEFTGFVSEEKLYKLFEAADIFVMASEYEGMPISLLEALSFGAIPIVSDIPELKLLINNRINGLYFKKGDHNNLNEKLQLLLNDKNMRNTMSQSCRELATSFDWRIIAEKTKEIYENLLSKRS